jgi:hypothetical protein
MVFTFWALTPRSHIVPLACPYFWTLPVRFLLFARTRELTWRRGVKRSAKVTAKPFVECGNPAVSSSSSTLFQTRLKSKQTGKVAVRGCATYAWVLLTPTPRKGSRASAPPG